MNTIALPLRCAVNIAHGRYMSTVLHQPLEFLPYRAVSMADLWYHMHLHADNPVVTLG